MKHESIPNKGDIKKERGQRKQTCNAKVEEVEPTYGLTVFKIG